MILIDSKNKYKTIVLNKARIKNLHAKSKNSSFCYSRCNNKKNGIEVKMNLEKTKDNKWMFV